MGRVIKKTPVPKTSSRQAPIVVIGAGASGLMAAIWGAGRGRPVIVLEGTDDGGRKLLITGGGRCNILPLASAPAPERFVTDSSPNSLRNILRSWPLQEQRQFFEDDLGLPLAQEPGTEKLFPECSSARQVRDRLMEEARRRGAELRFNTRAADMVPKGRAWNLTLADGSVLKAAAVILATGGCSVPATGSDGWGYQATRRLGHTVHPPYAALTPLTADPAVHAHLAGISLDVTVTAAVAGKKTVTKGALLFTHRGYSGPAVMDISHMAVRSRMSGGPRQELFVRWTALDAAAWEQLLLRNRRMVETLLAKHIPWRLAQTLCEEAGEGAGLEGVRLRRDQRIRLIEFLTRYPLPWTGHEGFTTAEVTGGGVDLGEVDPRTLESRLHPGLFICGEVLDAFGPIGGHNLHWAWTTGKAAGLGAGAGG